MRNTAEEENVSSTMKFVVGGLVVVVVIVAVIASGIGGSTSDYLSVAEAKALEPNQARDSRVAGAIVEDSVNWHTSELHVTVAIEDETGTLPISYDGPQPDRVGEAVEAGVIGK